MTQEALMTGRGIRLFVMGALAAVFLGVAAPAFAQNGTIIGRVLDSDRRTTDRDGKPLAGKPKDQTDPNLGLSEGIVTFELKGDAPKKFQTITDAFGGFYKSGLPPGTYDITVRREWRDPVPGRYSKLIVFVADASGIVLKPGEKLTIPDMGALTEEARAAGRKAPTTSASNMSTADAAAANKKNAEMEAMLKDAIAAATAGKHEEAITMFTAFAAKQEEKGEKCPACFLKIGESQLKLNAADKAEAAFLKAIELDPKSPDAYNQLASLYNGQRKFDDAAKMSAKANELAGAGATGGGGDAMSTFNAGIINWNAGKYPEARDEFAKVVKLDPKNANAQYYLGMAIFNLASSGKAPMADAKAPFQEYLKLAPTGEFAEVAKAILATIK
jgi:tetratricopeptide (TPR) repeat protein